jgi:hypothetical protein
MQRSSETLRAIAATLAKAQAELTNPEKSLVATIWASHPRDHDQTFRYAALSSGLDIARKALGGHEIATDHYAHPFVRGVAVVGMAGLPHQRDSRAAANGATLTYARWYALFTLVGIAGEDESRCTGRPTSASDRLGPGVGRGAVYENEQRRADVIGQRESL